MRFVIRGGKKLSGEIAVRGAKNAALKAMASSLLFETPVKLENMPIIEDVSRMLELLEGVGVAASTDAKKRVLKLDATAASGTEIKKEIGERFRASIVLAGPLLARLGKASFPYPGGCVIGRRPIDVFLDGWKAMGAKIKESAGGFSVEAKKLRGADYTFRVVSVTGTETLMMSASVAEGRTVLRNAALEPEIFSLASFLNSSGARIRGAGTKTIEIEGTGEKLFRAAESLKIIPDRIEAGSLLILGAALGNGVKISSCRPEHMGAVFGKLREAGVYPEIGDDWVTVRKPYKLLAVNAETKEYPGFPTDLQAPLAALMTQAEGRSEITETIFENRFGYIEDLNKMGANIILSDSRKIIVEGPTSLRGAEIASPDLRAGLAFVVAALLAEGESSVSNIYQIDRGYEKIDERLRKLGAEIERVD